MAQTNYYLGKTTNSAGVDKPHENDPILPTQKDPDCRMKVTPVRRLKKTPLADAN